MRKIFFPAAVTIAMSLAAATPATANDFNDVSISVATTNLDLSDPSQVVRLDRRLVHAANAACTDGSRGVSTRTAFETCRNAALTSARAQARKAVTIAMAKSGGARLAARR